MRWSSVVWSGDWGCGGEQEAGASVALPCVNRVPKRYVFSGAQNFTMPNFRFKISVKC